MNGLACRASQQSMLAPAAGGREILRADFPAPLPTASRPRKAKRRARGRKPRDFHLETRPRFDESSRGRVSRWKQGRQGRLPTKSRRLALCWLEVGIWGGGEVRLKISRLGKTRDYSEIGAPWTLPTKIKPSDGRLVGSFWSRALLVGSGYQDLGGFLDHRTVRLGCVWPLGGRKLLEQSFAGRKLDKV